MPSRTPPGRRRAVFLRPHERWRESHGNRDRVRDHGQTGPVCQPHAHLVAARQRLRQRTGGAAAARWDFEEESPLRDARGFGPGQELADPSQLTEEDLGLVNLILSNGARLYVDHAHPEYSTPE